MKACGLDVWKGCALFRHTNVMLALCIPSSTPHFWKGSLLAVATPPYLHASTVPPNTSLTSLPSEMAELTLFCRPTSRCPYMPPLSHSQQLLESTP